MSWSEDIGSVEKSDVMEDHYSKSDDPWGNRERQLYQKVLKYGAQKLFEYYNLYEKDQYPHDIKDDYLGSRDNIYCYDIGAGGGNILDTLIENFPDDKSKIHISGCDISESAIKFLNRHFNNYDKDFHIIDCDKYSNSSPNYYMAHADIITIVDVMYYWNNYRSALDEIWKTIKPGAIVLVADSIIPYQRRSYLKTKSDCKVLEEYTDYTVPMGALNDTGKNRFLKVKIYQKIRSNT